MDINFIREAVTVLSFAFFIGIVIWAWSSRNQDRFEQAAQLPFMEDDDAPRGDRR